MSNIFFQEIQNTRGCFFTSAIIKEYKSSLYHGINFLKITFTSCYILNYSLFFISKQVETVKEKRRMAVQFSKAGLEVSHSDQFFKTCFDGASYETEDESKSISEHRNDHVQPMVTETEVDASHSLVISQELGSCKQLNLKSGSVSGFSTEEAPGQDNYKHVREDSMDFSPASCPHDSTKASDLMVCFSYINKFWDLKYG